MKNWPDLVICIKKVKNELVRQSIECVHVWDVWLVNGRYSDSINLILLNKLKILIFKLLGWRCTQNVQYWCSTWITFDSFERVWSIKGVFETIEWSLWPRTIQIKLPNLSVGFALIWFFQQILNQLLNYSMVCAANDITTFGQTNQQ